MRAKASDRLLPCNGSIEEPTTPSVLQGELEGACGLSDMTKLRSSDLN
jgi:hypothetical protein